MIEKSDISEAIVNFNETYLLLAQQLLREDREGTRQMLGISDELAIRICLMTRAEIQALADRTELICEFRPGAAPGNA
jgi:flagellar transcriptional activator FlhD